MWTWLWLAALYLLVSGCFRWLGGVASAAEAIRDWGRTSAERRRRTSSSTSSA